MYLRHLYSSFSKHIKNIPHGYTSCNYVAISRRTAHTQSPVDRALERLSFEVRKSGRVRKRELRNLLDMIKQEKQGHLSSHQVSTVVRMFGSSIMEERFDNRTSLMHEVWEVLENSGAQLDISHYNTLLKLYVDSHYNFAPTDFLSMLEKKGIEPNRVTHQRFLARYCQEGDLDGALKVLEFMKDNDMPINANVFNSLIVGHLKAKDVENAKGIITMMEQQEVDVTNDTYRALLTGLAEMGDEKNFEEALQQCEEKGVTLKDADYLDIVVALSKSGHNEKVEQLMSKLRKGFGYNFEALNAVIRLVNAGKYEDGYKVLKTMSRPNSPSGEQLPTGGFFIKQLITCDAPVPVIVEWCSRLRSTDDHPYSFHIALHAAFLSEEFEKAHAIMEAFIENSIPLRSHYFWPFLAHYKKTKNETAIFETLRKMMALGAQVNYQTLYDYVYPAMEGSAEERVEKVRSVVSVTGDNAVIPMLIYLLQMGQVAEAAEIVKKYEVKVGSIEATLCRKFLVPRLSRAECIREACTVLRHFSHLTPELAKITNGQLVIDAMNQAQDKQRVALLILNNMVEAHLPISEVSGRIIEGNLGELIIPAIKEALARLTSMDPQEVSRQEDDRKSMYHEDATALQEELNRMKAAGKPIRGLARTLFIHYNRNWDLPKVEEMKKELDSLDMEYPIGDLALLLATYAENGKLDEALQCRDDIKKRDSASSIDSSKIMRLVIALVNGGRTPDGLKVLEEDLKPRKMQETTRFTMALCSRLLEAVANTKDVEMLQKTFQLLQQREFIANEQPMLAQLVRVHVLRNDHQSAVNKYEELCKSHTATPYQVELMKALIGCEATDLLQKVIDLSTEIHGEMNTLHDLAFAFLESGNLQQSKKVFETPGLRARNTRFEYFCQSYVNNDQTQELENLLKVTKNLFDIDRNMLYQYLLKSYCKSSNVDSALGIWTSIQEEDLDPSPELLIYLADFLEKNGRKVPFSIPEVASSSSSAVRTPQRASKSPEAKIVPETVDSLVKNYSVEGKLGTAMDLVREQVNNNNPIAPRILKLFVTKLGISGAFNYMEELSPHFNEDQKRTISFNGNLLSSYVHARKPDEAVEKLETWLREKEGKEWNFNTFPVRGVITLLEAYPDKYQKCLELANEYSSHGFFGPLNTLWIYSFLNRNFDEADRLWKSCLKDAQDLLFRSVLDRIWEKRDVDLAQRFTPVLIEAVVPEDQKINAFNRLAFSCVHASNSGAAIDIIKKALESQQMTEQDVSQKLHAELQRITGHTLPFKSAQTSAETAVPS